LRYFVIKATDQACEIVKTFQTLPDTVVNLVATGKAENIELATALAKQKELQENKIAWLYSRFYLLKAEDE